MKLQQPPIQLLVLMYFSLGFFTLSNAWSSSTAMLPTSLSISRNILYSTISTQLASTETKPPSLDTKYTIKKDDQDELVLSYLQRIGFSQEEAHKFITDTESHNTNNLQRLLSAHLRHVPFENMDQHCHPAHEETKEVPRREGEALPSLDVNRSLHKIINYSRGGFCFELNFSFNWLLQRLGYRTRLALADVACNQESPSHVVILVDVIVEEDVTSSSILVDVGFGDPGVGKVLLPLENDAPKYDSHGDLFEFKVDDTETDLHIGRFDTALYRYRVSAPDVREPMYRFRRDDNMTMDAIEFEEGLDRVLTTSPFFTTKRICVLSTDRGHVTLGTDYVKWVEKGETVDRIELPTETDWRNALEEYYGVVLGSGKQ